MKRFMLVLLCLTMIGAGGTSFAQQADGYRIPPSGVWLTVFTFAAEDTAIDPERDDNAAEMDKLLAYIDDNIEAIRVGSATILVRGYYADSSREAARIADIIKAEICSRRDIPEASIVMESVFYEFAGRQRMVLVGAPIRVPDPEPAPQPEPEPVAEAEPAPQPATEPVVDAVPEPQPQPRPVAVREVQPEPRINLSLRTNLLHWAAGMLNGGAEVRTGTLGFKLDGGWSHWKWQGEQRVWKIWYINPEVRRYNIGGAERFYLGAGISYASFNTRLSDTGYQGRLLGGGITGGYRLPLSDRLSMDFNLGLGYLRIWYDTFTVIEVFGDDMRVYKDKDKTRNWFGPVQAGVTLVWQLGKVKNEE